MDSFYVETILVLLGADSVTGAVNSLSIIQSALGQHIKIKTEEFRKLVPESTYAYIMNDERKIISEKLAVLATDSISD